MTKTNYKKLCGKLALALIMQEIIKQNSSFNLDEFIINFN